MLHSLASFLANRIFDKNDKYPMDIYIYGIELVISSTISTSLIILTGVLTHTFLECLIYLLSFSLIRIYTGGYHCMSYLRCNIVSVLSYIIVFLSVYYLDYFISNPYVLFSGYAISLTMAIFFAPVKHENKQVTNAERKKYKILSIILITFFYTICVLLFYIFDLKQTLIIFPTCITIDIAMLISIMKNNYISRRSSQ